MSALHQQKQQRDYDCALACIASFVERPYAEIWPADFLAVVDEAKGAYGEKLTLAFESAGLVKNEHYKVIFLPDSWIAAPQIKSILFGRRAFMQVPSLNNENGQHMVYWNGRELFDPSNKQEYKFLSHCQPSHLWLFDELATKGQP